ncbi:hypothetical protein ACFLQX_01830 [Bacteroidota bacterium]
MKNLLFIAAFALLVSCNTPAPETTDAAPIERSIGFNTMLPELKFHLGTEDAITVVKKLDEVWAAMDYDAMRPFFADTAKFFFPDGMVLKSADDFLKLLAEDESEHTWTFDYAYSVDLDPSLGGEHVQAGFTGTEVKDGVEKKNKVHESYYIVDGKIVMWTQYKMEVLEKE